MRFAVLFAVIGDCGGLRFPVTNASSTTLLTCGACDVRSATDARNQWPIRLGMDAELSPLKYVGGNGDIQCYR